MNLSAYDEPQPLRRLIEDILSPKELDRFRQLDEAYRAARRGDLPFEDLDSADDEWQDLHRLIDDGAKETLARGELLVRGWLPGDSSQQPTLMPPGLLADGQLWVAENEVRANGQRYVSCTLVRSNSALAIGSAEGPKPGSPGRPPNRNMQAAYQEAVPRIEAGEKRDAVAFELAKKYGVLEKTLRTYLKPSRAPKWTKA